MRILLAVIILALGAGGMALLISSKPDAKPVEVKEQAWQVAAEKIKLETQSPELRLYGVVESPWTARLSAAVTADVKEVLVLPGQSVVQDEPLIRLDDNDQQLVMLQRQADIADLQAQIDSEKDQHASNLEALKHEKELLRLSRKSVDRARRLAKTRVGSEAGVDDALKSLAQQSLAVSNRQYAIDGHQARLAQLQARLDRAQAGLQQAQRDLQRTILKSPFAARVTRINIAPGNRVRAGDVLIELFDLDRVEIRAQVPNQRLAQFRQSLAEGQSIQATLQQDYGLSTSLTLARLSGEVESGRGGVDAFFRFDTPNHDMEIGRTVTLSIVLPTVENVASVPAIALYGNNRIYKIVDERMQGFFVERVGETIDEKGEQRILIRGKNLQNDDRIVTSQLPNAVDGLKVTTEAETQ